MHNYQIDRAMIEVPHSELTRAAQSDAEDETHARDTDQVTPRHLPRVGLIGLFTTIAMFALPIADAFAGRSWT